MFGARRAAENFDKVEKMLHMIGLEKERVRREMVSAAEASRFAQIVTEMIEQVKKLGPSPLRKTPQKSQKVQAEASVA